MCAHHDRSDSSFTEDAPADLRPEFQFGKSPEMDAWLTSFFIENHLDFFTYPDHAATEEQVRFMVFNQAGERYYPCSDRMFEAIISRKQSAFIQKHYNKALQKILDLIERQIEEPYEKSYLESLVINKYKLETRDEIIIPSRLEKRLMSIYLKRTLIGDPFLTEKTQRNRYAHQVLQTPALGDAINFVEKTELKNPPETLGEIKSLIAAVEFKRLLYIANTSALWIDGKAGRWTKQDFLSIFDRPITDDGLKPLMEFLGFGKKQYKNRKLLWLADEAGETVMDLAVIRFLVFHGHKVIVAFKQGPLYTKTTIGDMLNDPVLQEALGHAVVIDDPNLSKNELVRTLRGDVSTLALSDGTSENLNLLLTSTTFARIFKEVDAVMSRGEDQRRRFFDTHFQFTQDIYSIVGQKDGSLSIRYKPRHLEVIKFSHEDLEKKALTIIDRMKAAKSKGMTVIFYSGIIGSIPGKKIGRAHV